MVSETAISRAGTVQQTHPRTGFAVNIPQIAHAFVQVVNFSDEVVIADVHECGGSLTLAVVTCNLVTIEDPLFFPVLFSDTKGGGDITESHNPC
ncbi:hypothetical protein HmCmsJML016_01884 [Escherichia coli]|nr:hypothetical protein ExPECSC017_02921 [Escherichia coli]GCS83830.1 hypothetical protein HmCmsJML016_01884 [Escherichia coli]GCT64315.1 hypothetical protein HmCms173_02706 [Escherichia coli]GCV45141.1 hypothetical protein HmCmsJML055_00612 [Escherichia coli]GCX31801.1 hypothetical protein HmCmsJML105_03926 [Escherichia coli]